MEISYNADAKDQGKQITPNIVGFQLVMAGIAKRTREGGSAPTQIVVDRQGEFNGAQRILSEFYAEAAGIKFENVPGVMELSFDGMPQIPVTFCPGHENCGLELADIYTWLFKLAFERKKIAPELQLLVDAQMGIGNTDELSLRGIRYRISRTLAERPELFRVNACQGQADPGQASVAGPATTLSVSSGQYGVRDLRR